MKFNVTVLCLFVYFVLVSAQYHERMFTMVKPDGVQRGLVGRIIQRFEQKGFKLTSIKLVHPTEEMLREHYRDLAEEPFFAAFIKEMSELGPVVPMVWEGLNAVKIGRLMIGERNPAASKPGTIRGDFCIQASHNSGRNVIHGSDSVEEAIREIKVWFNETEIVSWKPLFTKVVYNQENYME